MLFSFGFSAPIDMLSWVVALMLGAKLIATLVLLLVGRDVRDRPGWGPILWWVTKLTPIVAIPCAIAIALLQRQFDAALLFGAMALFVAIAVPLKVRQRQARIARGTR
ncbi:MULTISPECIES: hypothetical protein [Sphingomonas]|nr:MULTISPECIES: hypothetical protein [Sphingomonas]MBB4049561.1 putative membrane protein AbrB (regulator of aidB expression) [Sphingomonas zeae]MDK8187713.1 hypothetical protein [Sphingomonas zeae]MDK8217508.1 hypothetical protein [Sphingomonas sp. UMB7805-LC452B]